MNEEQERFIQSVDNSSADKVIVKNTGREDINLPPHSHDCIQLVVMVCGTLHVTVNGRDYFVPDGYACWIPRGAVHALTSNNRHIALRIFYFLPKNEEEMADGTFSVHYVCPWASVNFQFIADYGPVIGSDDSGLHDFCLSFFRTFRKEERQIVLPLKGIDAGTHPILRKAMLYLHNHLSDNVKMEQAAKAAGVSLRTLSRLFNEADTTFSNYLCYQRIIRSLELMAENSMTIKEISYNVGFSSPVNFNRAFKQVMGVTPSEMKRKQGKLTTLISNSVS